MLEKTLKYIFSVIFMLATIFVFCEIKISADFASPAPSFFLTKANSYCTDTAFTHEDQRCTIYHGVKLTYSDRELWNYKLTNNTTGRLQAGRSYFRGSAKFQITSTFGYYDYPPYTNHLVQTGGAVDAGWIIKNPQNIDYKTSTVYIITSSIAPKCTVSAYPSGYSGFANSYWWPNASSMVVSANTNSYDANGSASIDKSYGGDGFYGVSSNDNSYTQTIYPYTTIKAGDNSMITTSNLFGVKGYCTFTSGHQVDSNAPSCSVSANITNWTNKDITLSFKCNDTQSGCATPTKAYTISTNGTYSYECKDNVGNKGSNATIDITKIDKVKPTCGATTPINTNYYYNTNYGVKVACSDNASKCTANSYEGTASTSGYSSITIYDNAGNSNACPATTQQFDTSAPTTTITLADGHQGYNGLGHQTSVSVVATISATDSGKAGIKKVCYKLSGATTKAETCVDGSSTQITLTNTGVTTIEAWSYDNAYDWNNGSPKWNGNRSSTASKQVYVDKVNPIINITNPSDTWTNNLPSLAFNVSDANSGVRTVQYVWAPTQDSTVAFNSYYKATGTTLTPNSQGGAILSYIATFPESAKNDPSLSDQLYLHVKVCDRAYSTYNNEAPNCSTKVSGKPFKFDFINQSEITVSGGGTDTGAYKGSGVDWTHKIEGLTFKVVNDNIGNYRSGIERINLYFDVNEQHVNENKNSAQFTGTPDLVKICSTDHTSASPTTCQHVIDFAALKSDPVQAGQPFVATEGVRFIKVETIDLAGNKTSKVFGPFKWDITKSKITSNVTFSGTENGKFFVDR